MEWNDYCTRQSRCQGKFFTAIFKIVKTNETSCTKIRAKLCAIFFVTVLILADYIGRGIKTMIKKAAIPMGNV